MAISERDTMGGLAKGLAVIETFNAQRTRQSIAEVSAASGLDRATARRCLLTLAHIGYADYDGKYFTLTPRVLRLGTACLATMPLPHMVQPLLDELSEEMGDSSAVAIFDAPDIVYVARAAQRKVLSITLMPGSRLPAHCTSMGRVMLSALPEATARQVLLSAPIVPRTSRTLTDPDSIMAELARVRTNGYALIDQEVELGVRSIAVPIQNSRGTTIAAMSIGAPAVQVGVEDLVEQFLVAMLRVQAELRAMLR